MTRKFGLSLPVISSTSPTGTPVLVVLDDYSIVSTVTRSPPWQLGHGAWVVSLKGRSGGFDLKRVFVGPLADSAEIEANEMESEAAFLAAAAKDCDSCPCCQQVPCDACQAGGVCDAVECRHEADDRARDSDDVADAEERA